MLRFVCRVALMSLFLFGPLPFCHAQIKELGTGAPGPVKAPHLTAELISDGAEVSRGGTIRVALALSLEPGWHVYWSNAGDSGQPPEATWALPKNVSVGQLEFPAPMRLPLGPLVDYGYEGTAVFPAVLTASPDLPSGLLPLSVHVRWLVCREVCIPGRAYLGLSLQAVAEAHASLNPLIEAAVQAEPRPLPPGSMVVATSSKDELQIEIHTGQGEISAYFYPLEDGLIRNAAEQHFAPAPQGGRLTVERSDPSTTPPARVVGVLELPKGRSYTLDIPVLGVIESAAGTAASSASHQTLSVVLLLAFAGGVLLNLMPCVFPVLFLKGLSLAESSGQCIASQRKHGAVYTVGILFSFWSIVGVLLLLRRFGQHAGWGFQLQSPTFVVCMACLLFFLSLSLAGMFDLGLTLTSTGGELAQKQGHAGSFFTGVLATIVATPCTAPLMGTAIGFALAQTAVVTFLIFTVLALGLALPYIVLTFVPSLARLLPKPGRWMETLKQWTAVPLFLTVVWLVWVYARLNGPSSGESSDHTARLLLAFVLLGIAAWVLGRWPVRIAPRIAALGIVVAALAIPWAASGAQKLDWHPYSGAAVTEATSSGKPVFIDFTAAWCLSCQINERVVLQSADVQRRLSVEHFVLLRADWTRYDPEITDALGRVGRSGVPTYVILSGGKVQVLPEVLTKAVVEKAIGASRPI